MKLMTIRLIDFFDIYVTFKGDKMATSIITSSGFCASAVCVCVIC